MLQRLAAFAAIPLFAASLLGQGLDTQATKDDWEEINFDYNSSIVSATAQPGVKALGFDLPEKGWVQVSMNLVDYRATTPIAAYDAVKARADAAGVQIAGSELVGLIPAAACPAGFAERVRLLSFDPDQVIETRIAKRRGAKSS